MKKIPDFEKVEFLKKKNQLFVGNCERFEKISCFWKKFFKHNFIFEKMNFSMLIRFLKKNSQFEKKFCKCECPYFVILRTQILSPDF